MKTYQVNYEKKYITGPLAGKCYHRHAIFNSKNDALFFANGDGLQYFKVDEGTYIQRNSEIVDLTEFLK